MLDFCVSSPLCALGSSTLIDGLFTMSGAATIMLISSTSVTSTSGVTLMSLMAPPTSSSSVAAGPVPATLLRSPGGGAVRVRVQLAEQHLRQPVGAGEPPPHLPVEVVVGNDRGQRHQQTDRRRDERLRERPHDRLRPLPLLRSEVVEGADDADDRAEETDERR